MQVTLSAKGTPKEVVAAIGRDVAHARRANESAADVLYATRDHIAKYADTCAETDIIGVDVTITITTVVAMDGASINGHGVVHGQPFVVAAPQKTETVVVAKPAPPAPSPLAATAALSEK